MAGFDVEDPSFQFTWESIAGLCHADPAFRKIVSLRRIQAERFLAHDEKPLPHPLVVLDGCLRVEAFERLQPHQSQERRKLFALPFGEGAVLDASLFVGWTDYRIKAVDTAIVCYLKAELDAIGLRWSHVLEALLRSQIAVQQQIYDEQLEAYEPLRTRLVRLLLRESKAGRAPIIMSHKAIAERLGTYRETVSNQLSRLKNGGAIDYGYRVIQVLDADQLDLMTYASLPQ